MGARLVVLALLLFGFTYGDAGGIFSWGEEPLDDGARCDVNAVRRANREQLHLLLEELTNTTFFRLFRVGLDGVCPMMIPAQHGGATADESVSPSCSVSDGEESSQCSLKVETHEKDLPPWMMHKQPVDRTISVQERTSVASDLSCETPDFWFDMCLGLVSEDESRGWINLQLNPERHTAYNGSKVWQNIYEQACFADAAFAVGGKQEGCAHEQRVLQRLISGLHASINTHIALFFHPPSPSKPDWLPNPARFMETVGSHPERVRNLNFAFVVLLRALRKAAPVLSSFSYAVSGDSVEDLRTAALVRRLLDTHLMSSCSQVFDSFDESLMFQNQAGDVKKAFKEAFISISKTFDCVKCQKCRLHGKMQLTGIGLALKILFLSEEVILTTPVDRIARREEIVALFNTLYKFSHAINSVDILTEMHLRNEKMSDTLPHVASPSDSMTETQHGEDVTSDVSSASPIQKAINRDALADTVASVARAYFAGALNDDDEKALLSVATAADDTHQKLVLIALARSYGATDPSRFAVHCRRLVLASTKDGSLVSEPSALKTVVVVGSGLAGSAAALSLLDLAAAKRASLRVILLEKQHFLGGNSVYASSGMNAVDEEARKLGDSTRTFALDMARSSGKGDAFAYDPMVTALTQDAEDALKWVRTRIGADFSQLGKLGGHSFARTHRPERGQAGAELVFAMHKLLKDHSDAGRLVISKGERFLGVNRGADGLLDVRTAKQVLQSIDALVLASGGYAANKTLLPDEVRGFGTTNGPFATGDAVQALTELGASFRDMDKVQLHPTAFASEDKTVQQPLCAEILRGVGGILLNSKCERFVDELGTRAHVSNRMIALGEKDFVLVLSAEQAKQAEHFRSTYLKRGLLTELESPSALARYAHCSEAAVRKTFEKYQKEGIAGKDDLGKKSFSMSSSFLTSKMLYAGRVQPATHYCMGGVATDDWSRVLDAQQRPIKRVYAAGEVSGGLHGDNRLGGNGMTEGLVFGRRAARAVVGDLFGVTIEDLSAQGGGTVQGPRRTSSSIRKVTMSELSKHNTADDCWVSIRGKVFNFSSFIREHPGGVKAVLDVAGRDGTEMYEEIHSPAFLEDFTPIGELIQS